MTPIVPAMEFRGLTKRYPHRDGSGDLTVLDGLTRSIMSGEFVTMVGPSGCGKSTLFKLILGSIRPTEGEVLVGGQSVMRPGPDRGIVYQNYSLYPHLTVVENVMLSATLRRPPFAGWFGWKQQIEAGRVRAMEYLARVSIDDSADKYPHELSGGMRQRVAIVQALFTKPEIILMDEPFGALDAGTRHDAQRFLIELWEEFGMTILFVTHALDESVYLGTKLLVLSQHWEHKDGAHRTDNGADFVLEYDLREFVERRRSMTYDRYVAQPELVHIQSEINTLAMDERMRQHRNDFFVGAPPVPLDLSDSVTNGGGI